MNFNDPVPLERRFSHVPRSEHDTDEQPSLEVFGHQKGKGWLEIDARYRTVILAEAGAGKTFEMYGRSKFIRDQGRYAFFFRIEDIVDDFDQAFQGEYKEEFEQWLASQSEAWFFLDSVDEARLSNPRDFAKAIRRFAVAIKPAQLRAHVCISSRPYAWRQKSDSTLIERFLPFKMPRRETMDWESESDEVLEQSEMELEIFQLDPLDENDIRLFADHRLVPDVDKLIDELERSNAMTLADRPFDLEGILDKWKKDRDLGSRFELLEHNIELRLSESEPDNKLRRPLNPARAREGTRILAAAVILCDKPGIHVPDYTLERTGIEADVVLSDWEPGAIQILLERAIFNDVIYGTVRFRHREVREFLAAQWFVDLLQKHNSRLAVESLIFREQYGEIIISPRLRPLLPWLILKDEKIRNRTLSIHPEIAVEGGDPACLPLHERETILNGILSGIVQEDKKSSAQNTSAIIRIAQSDLTAETLSLIDKYCMHDNAIFFLGRLVWQGKMSQCVPPLLTVAVDPNRGIYARKAATRAIMSCGTIEQRCLLWNTILENQVEIPRELLAELLEGACDDERGVVCVLKAIVKLPPYNRFEVTGLREAIHGYIDRLPISKLDSVQPVVKFIDGLNAILEHPPHLEDLSCSISKEFAWLLEPATHAVEKLVSERANATMQDGVLSILENSPIVRESFGRRYDEYKDILSDLVPAWPELNDTLFWMRVKKIRVCLENDGNRLTSYHQVRWPEHYWSFGPDSFSRVLDWVKTCEVKDDQLIAISLAFHIYLKADRTTELLDNLRAAVNGSTVLMAELNKLLNPTPSKLERKWHQKVLQQKEEREQRRLKQIQNRSEWIDRLKADPDLVCKPPGLKQGEMSYDQFWLMREIQGNGPQTSRAEGVDWKLLIDEFGIDVARAYREAAMQHWRCYDPGLPSEGANTSSIPCSTSFALAGLEIEARENSDFPTHLNNSEVDQALRYTTWEINGFPSWLEAMFQAKQQDVVKVIQTEIYWELDNANADQRSYGLLHDLTYRAPWLHKPLIEPLSTWLQKNDPPNVDTLRYCLHILKSGGMAPDEIGELARSKIGTEPHDEILAQWFAIWVDALPDSGIPALTNLLSNLDVTQSTHFAQLFITSLMGNRLHSDTGINIDRFHTAKHLKSLCVLMHTHIRVEDDVHRANKGAFSPTLRDHAQEARNWTFNLLSNIQGKAAYVALKELIKEHPNADYRSWMKEQAYRRAEEDGNLEPWTAAQVCQFNSRLTRKPETQRQLFDLTVDYLFALKNWLEQGDTSPYATWQNAKSESEIRNLVSGWLDQSSDHSFTLSQESELSNKQRMDIRIQNQDTEYPIPIELKLLDNNWTGPSLCKSLCNQLVGDYLREGTERYGVILLVRKGIKPAKRWKIDGKLVDVSNLRDALKNYWISVSDQYSNVEKIDVMVIDMSLRAIK